MKKQDSLKKEKVPFTQVSNEVLYDSNLSAKAKGLYAYLYAKPEKWDFAIDRIANEMADGRKSVNNGLQELEQQGYLYRERKSTGRVIYVLKSQMTKMDIGAQKPDVQNGKVPKRQSAETDTVRNKEGEEIKSIRNKEGQSKSSAGYNSVGAEIIKAFEEVNPACKKYYGNKTQRGACDRLIEEYGLDEVLKRIPYLNKTNKMKYLPTINTPLQLEEKWTQLHDNLQRMKQDHDEIKNTVAFS